MGVGSSLEYRKTDPAASKTARQNRDSFLNIFYPFRVRTFQSKVQAIFMPFKALEKSNVF
jgi:hypothetical protein